MATVLFYEKPGCINNREQQRRLRSAGHTVDARNLLTEAWTPERLRPFFGDLPVAQWFNLTAPAVKQGRVDPEKVSADEALALMIDDPLLIRRPLMQVGEQRRVGFDAASVHRWLGLGSDAAEIGDIETCPMDTDEPCP